MQVIETRKKKIRADPPDPLTSVTNLACTWKGIGKDIEAVRLIEEGI